MLHRYGFAFLAAVLALPRATAVDTGAIDGHVRNASGQPLARAQVLVVGTALGVVTNDSGYYFISRVPTGTYTLRAQFIGYTPTEVVGVKVTAGATTTIDATLTYSALTVAGINVVAAANPIVPRDEVSSKTSITTGALRSGEAHVYVDGAPARLPVQMGDAQSGVIGPWRQREPWNTESYGVIDENPFIAVSAHPLSTFSSDVDRASYSNVRRFINEGQLPPRDAVRIEELVNYFPYAYAEPEGDDPVAIHTEVAAAPWNRRHQLVRIGIQARRIDLENTPPSNLVFLIDVSGSMDEPDKLPLLKSAFHLLVRQLRAKDRVAIVVYAGTAGLVLPSTSGAEKERIDQAIDNLEAGGSTAGGAGIKRAYEEAVANFIRGGNNRVLLATDGDFNVGVSSDAEMVQLIEEERKTGVFLTTLGFGQDNLKDSKMEQMADHGNGQYDYIDNLLEAQKVFVQELGGTLYTVAKDVKIQVEFNPAQVQGYRLLGYEDRLLRDEDFKNDKKDAGDMGSGHSVTALYEVIPAGETADVDLQNQDALRYQPNRGPDPEPYAAEPGRTPSGEMLFVKVRYKTPTGETSRLLTHPVSATATRSPSVDFRFQAAVVEFALLLRKSAYRGEANIRDVIATARESLGSDPEGYRSEFVRLAEAARSMVLPLDGEDDGR
ncbi:MAG TPA: von Willebrand factor type A domain-containing protein [Gemmatimonadales bacterium]|nr:von Willebrand factor type A domain-containing protein [Gemmatimonadales bacterium]